MYQSCLCRFFGLACMVLPLALAGCFSYHGASGKSLATEPLGADAWPAFETASLEPLLDTPKVIERAHVDKYKYNKATKENLDADMLQALQDSYTDDLLVSHLDGHGLTRVWKTRVNATKTHEIPMFFNVNGFLDNFVRNAQFLTGPILEREIALKEIKQKYGPETKTINMGAYFGIVSTGAIKRWHLKRGMEMAVPVEVADDTPGLIIHITSLMENEYEHALTDKLARKGYAVAYLESETFLDGPQDLEQAKRRAQQKARRVELLEADPKNPVPKGTVVSPTKAERDIYDQLLKKYMVQVEKELPSIEDGLQIHPHTDLDALGKELAREVDEVIAEHAYAVEGLVDACDRIYPSLTDKPIIVLGYSAGTLPAPAVVARLHQRYPDRAVLLVLVGGGGDLLTIARHSVFGQGTLHLSPKNGPTPTPEQLDALQQVYLQHVKLDPLMIAPAIRDIPVLHIFAQRDTAVPTKAAHMFNTAHGHVDCIVHPGGHGTLFYFVKSQAGRIHRWISQHSSV